MDCGQSDPISKLVGHVTEDQRLQESIGDPRASIVGLNQDNLMPPQSFRMNDLVREMEHIKPQRMPTPSPSSSHFDVQSHSSLGTVWTTEYQNQIQGTFQPKIDQMWNIPNVPKYFPAEGFINGLPESQICMRNFIESHFESQSGESRKTVADLEGTITIENVNELENLNQTAENCTYLEKEIQDEQLPNQNCNDDIIERKTIPEFTNTKHFIRIVEKYIDRCRRKAWSLQHPNEKYYNDITSESLLNPTEYSHIDNNPMRDELELSKKGNEALENGWFSKAELYFDQAIRKMDPCPRNWLKLSYALLMNNKFEKAISTIKHYLRLKPNCFEGVQVQFVIYESRNCTYQACQTLFNWLKNNESYKHIIPATISMNDKDMTELDDELLNSVKNIFLKAARENPKNNIDSDLQIMIGHLYFISKDYDKVADCILTAIKCSEEHSYEMRNLGYLLFYDDKPNEALHYFFKVAAQPNCGATAYEDIGYVYMYLKNFREAIRYFKMLLGPEGLGDETNFQLRGNTLEDEYDLCLRLYCKIRNR